MGFKCINGMGYRSCSFFVVLNPMLFFSTISFFLIYTTHCFHWQLIFHKCVSTSFFSFKNFQLHEASCLFEKKKSHNKYLTTCSYKNHVRISLIYAFRTVISASEGLLLLNYTEYCRLLPECPCQSILSAIILFSDFSICFSLSLIFFFFFFFPGDPPFSPSFLFSSVFFFFGD